MLGNFAYVIAFVAVAVLIYVYGLRSTKPKKEAKKKGKQSKEATNDEVSKGGKKGAAKGAAKKGAAKKAASPPKKKEEEEEEEAEAEEQAPPEPTPVVSSKGKKGAAPEAKSKGKSEPPAKKDADAKSMPSGKKGKKEEVSQPAAEVEDDGFATVKSKREKADAKSAEILKTAAAVNKPEVAEAKPKKAAKAKAAKAKAKEVPPPEEEEEEEEEEEIKPVEAPVAGKKKKKKAKEEPAAEAPKKAAEPAAPKEETQEQKNLKEKMKWEKKLREIDDLINRQESGEALLENQKTKITSRTKILAEIDKLGGNEESKAAKDKEAVAASKTDSKENAEALKWLAEQKTKETGAAPEWVQKAATAAAPKDAASELEAAGIFSKGKKAKKGFVNPWEAEEQKKAKALEQKKKDKAAAGKNVGTEKKEDQKPAGPPPTEREKMIFKISKTLREIAELEKKQAEGQTLAANQLPKLAKKAGLEKELQDWQNAEEPWQTFHRVTVSELMKPLHGCYVHVNGENVALSAAYMDPPLPIEDLHKLQRMLRVGQQLKVRVLRGGKRATQLSEEEEEALKEEIEEIQGQLDALMEEAMRLEKEWKSNPSWSKWSEASVISSSTFGIFVKIGPSRDILIPVRSMAPDFTRWDNEFGQAVPDRKVVAAGSRVRLRVRYIESKDQLTGTMLDDSGTPVDQPKKPVPVKADAEDEADEEKNESEDEEPEKAKEEEDDDDDDEAEEDDDNADDDDANDDDDKKDSDEEDKEDSDEEAEEEEEDSDEDEKKKDSDEESEEDEE